MPYLRVSFDEHEIDRRDLTEAIVIGRSPECDVAVRDVLLSRRHCRIVPRAGGGWQAIDLASKNGTVLNGTALTAAVELNNGDELKLGRLTARFFAGRLAEARLTVLRAAPLRPADPNESMSGTFAGFAFLEPGQSPACANFPRPRPSPRAPAAFERDDLYSLLSTIASSSWDSIYAEARRPLPAGTGAGASQPCGAGARRRPRSPIDLSLHVRHGGETSRARRGRPRGRRLAVSGLRALLILMIFSLKFWTRVRLAAPAQAAAPALVADPPRQTTDAEMIVRSAAPFLSLVL